MSEHDKEKLLDHNYDGIQEFDNPLPGWWLATFYGTIIFAALYIGYYHLGSGRGPNEELATELESVKAKQQTAQQGQPEGPNAEELQAVFADAARRDAGKKIFAEKCATCHGPEGGGLIGPNLTDNYWIHGKGTLVDIATVVSEGVLDKGMPPWKTMLKKDEIYSVVAFVKSLKGSHPSNPKPPQGEEVKD
jgi:cytochrome c oxidase cbb3-type subunit III